MLNICHLSLLLPAQISEVALSRLLGLPVQYLPHRKIVVEEHQAKKEAKAVKNKEKPFRGDLQITTLTEEDTIFIHLLEKSNKQWSLTLVKEDFWKTANKMKLFGQQTSVSQQTCYMESYQWESYTIEYISLSGDRTLIFIKELNAYTAFDAVKFQQEFPKFLMNVFEEIVTLLFCENANSLMERGIERAQHLMSRHAQLASKVLETKIEINFALLEYAIINECFKIE